MTRTSLVLVNRSEKDFSFSNPRFSKRKGNLQVRNTIERVYNGSFKLKMYGFLNPASTTFLLSFFLVFLLDNLQEVSLPMSDRIQTKTFL